MVSVMDVIQSIISYKEGGVILFFGWVLEGESARWGMRIYALYSFCDCRGQTVVVLDLPTWESGQVGVFLNGHQNFSSAVARMKCGVFLPKKSRSRYFIFVRGTFEFS